MERCQKHSRSLNEFLRHNVPSCARRALTLMEVIVVLAIISLLLAMLLPAVQSARERARETVCKNNVHQINLAVARYAEAHKELPPPSSPRRAGGWMVEILPFIEQQNLRDTLEIGSPLEDVPKTLFVPPLIFRCPGRSLVDVRSSDELWFGHYVLVPTGGRESYNVFDAPVDLSVAWLSGPEMDYHAVTQARGPHHDGFFFASGFQQGVDFMLNGRKMR